MGIFNINHTELDSKINELLNKVDRAQPIFVSPSKQEWNSVFELSKEINENFKNVRYPSKQERDIAWQKFANLRDKAFNVHNQQIFDCSKKHYNELMSELHSVDYDAFGDGIVGKVMSFGLLAQTKEGMIIKGKELKQIGINFTSVKYEMTKDHKEEVFKRIIEVRENHNIFWEKYKSYSNEKSKLYEEKQRDWEAKKEKGRQIKSSIENNLEKNRDKLSKAQNALENFKGKKNDLRDKIYESQNDNWKYKAESWLDEFDAKIRNIEEFIERLEKWIEEDRDKLRNWND